ncbi:MAG: DMT family transporter [Betaproteobacteria bacterium]|nr:DMT family transporter [Betaproteobacteria bacterium]
MKLPAAHPLEGFLLATIAAIGFSSKAIFVKLAYQAAPVDAITLLSLRMAFSLPAFIGFAFFSHNKPAQQPLNRHDLLLICGLGLVGYYLSSLLDFMGLHYLSAGLERLILFLYPTLTVLLSAVLLKHAITRKHVMALLLSYSGIALALLQETSHGGPDLWLGAGLVFASTLSYSVYLTGAGHAIARIGSVRFTALSMMVASAATLLQFGLTHPFSKLILPMHVYALAMGMALFSTVLPVFALSAAIRLIQPGRAALIGSIGPISTIFMAYFILNEAITVAQLAGSALVLAGVWLIGRDRTPQ